MLDKITLSATVATEQAGKRLDQAAAQLFPDYSRARLQAWIKAGALTVNKRSAKVRDAVHLGDLLEVDAEPEAAETAGAEDIPLDIVHSDDALLVINKPPGVVVHPGAGNQAGTLLNGLLHRFPELAAVPRAGIVHRLDKDTSGLMVVARTLESQTDLVRQLQARTVGRHYLAVVRGTLSGGGKVDAPIGRHPSQRTKMAVVAAGNGKPAVTHYTVARRFGSHSLLELKLETGRTHQIRVHMASIKHPLVGDPVYGGRQHLPRACHPELARQLQGFPRQALHAARLDLIHPASGEPMSWKAATPDDTANLIEALTEFDPAQ